MGKLTADDLFRGIMTGTVVFALWMVVFFFFGTCS